MKTRGRNSAASLSVVVAGGFGNRPNPPPHLTKRQKTIWQDAVAGEDPNFFNTGALRGLLADYCRRRSVSDELTEVIDTLGGVWIDEPEQQQRYDQLLKMRDREMAAVISLATKLRLTNQSRYLADVAARAARKAPKQAAPWEG